jgi:hypothetical protein
MLLPDGTCPRCSPPTLRPPEEAAAIAEYYGDEKLARHAAARQQGVQPLPVIPPTVPPAPTAPAPWKKD